MSKLRSGLRNDRRRYKCCNSNKVVTVVSGQASFYEGLEQVDITGLYDAGETLTGLDDGDVPISMNFNFFGSTSSMYWSSNNAIIFGTPVNQHLEINIPRTRPAILIGNYDRSLKTFYSKNIVTTNYSMTVLRVEFYDYYTNTISDPTYQYQIRLIKTGSRQFVEVYVISSPPSPGYSTANIMYPSSTVGQTPIDSNANTIDATKHSPYNITNGTNFLNPCGTTYSTSSPSTNTSFVFSSDWTGTTWEFHNNSYVSV